MKRYMMGLLMVGAVLGGGQAQAFQIDDMNHTNNNFPCPAAFDPDDNGQCVRVNAVAGTSFNDLDKGLPLSSTVGGSRYIQLDASKTSATSATLGINLSVDPNPKGGGTKDNPGTGTMDYSNPSGYVTRATLIYDADGAKFDADLTDGGKSDAFLWKVLSLDINLRVTVVLEDTDGTIAGNSFLKLPNGRLHDASAPCNVTPLVCVQDDGSLLHTLSLLNTGGIDPARPGVSFFDDPFNPANDTDLDPTGGDNFLNLDHIRKISVFYDTELNTGSPSLDLSEDFFGTTSTVPEPGTVLLMGTGLLGLGLVSARSRVLRRRQQQ